MVEVAGMVGVPVMVGMPIMVGVAGMEVSGSGQDGVDGVRGGGVLRTIRTIHTIHTIRHHLSLPNSSLRHMSSRLRNQRNNITGISAKILRATIRM